MSMSRITQLVIDLKPSNSESSDSPSACPFSPRMLQPCHMFSLSASLTSPRLGFLQRPTSFSSSTVKLGTRNGYKSLFSGYLKSTCPPWLGDKRETYRIKVLDDTREALPILAIGDDAESKKETYLLVTWARILGEKTGKMCSSWESFVKFFTDWKLHVGFLIGTKISAFVFKGNQSL